LEKEQQKKLKEREMKQKYFRDKAIEMRRTQQAIKDKNRHDKKLIKEKHNNPPPCSTAGGRKVV
jgi:hypothetical protein